MKVLHLGAGNLFGGIERLLVTLARRRDDSPKMSPVFALSFEGQLANELRQTGADVWMLGAVRASRPWTLWKARRRLKSLLNENEIDMVVAHACWPLAMFGPVARSLGLPLTLWCHDIVTGKHWIERRARKPDLIIANSGVTRASAAKLFADVPTQIMWYPVEFADGGDRAATRREMNISDKQRVIICASRMERWKGHALLIDALTGLREQNDWVCWIAGGAQRPEEQAYLAELQNAANAGGIAQRVNFLGQRRDVARLLAAADIHCQANTGPEPFGIAFIEAMGAGLPIVTTALGAPLEYVDESCGALTPPGNAQLLADELRSMIEDDGRRRSLGEGARLRALEMCNPVKVMKELEGTLHGLAAHAT